MTHSMNADALIEHLQLRAHPEGGWYRETWRSAASEAGGTGSGNARAKGTAILFLLKSGEASHWHKVDAEEMWLWQGGDPLDLAIADEDAGPVRTLRLGNNVAAGEQLQGLVPTGAWQAARPATPKTGGIGYCLVSCIVVPGFEFAGFELASPGWSPGEETQA